MTSLNNEEKGEVQFRSKGDAPPPPSTGKKFEMMHLDSELTSSVSLFKGIFTNFYSKILREATPPSPLTKKPLYVYVLLLTGITIHTFKV